MRPEMVENGLKFLRHPNVQNTPLSERVSFLEQKGMTKEEIQGALERFQSEPEAMGAPSPGPAVVQAVAAAAPMVAAVAAPAQQLMRRRLPTYMRVLLTISSVVGAATILGFLWNSMLHAGYFPWLKPSRRMIEAAKAEDEEATEAANVKETALLTSLEGVSSAIQSQTEELSRLCATIDKKEDELTAKQSSARQISSAIAEQSTVQAIAELKAEVSTLKALLLSKQSGDANANSVAANAQTSASPASTTAATATATTSTAIITPKEPVVVKETSAQRMQNALKKFRQENTMEQLKLAAGILIMYVKNLVENPDVPRYRRIAPANANFKQKIEPLQHHDELLKSIGFESTGLNMEWKWHLLDRANGEFDEHLAILKGLLKALQAVSSAKSSDPLALEEIAQQSLDEFYKQKEEKEAEKSQAETPATETATTTSEATTTASTSSSGTTTTTINKAEMHFTTASTAKTDTNLEAFLSRLEQKTAKSFEDKLSVMSAAAEANTTTESVVAADADAGLDEEKAPVPVSIPAAATVSSESTAVEASSGEPPYPKSFTEVMEMLKKGETVPGIQEIEERISDDSAKFLSDEATLAVATGAVAAPVTALPAKPWEKR